MGVNMGATGEDLPRRLWDSAFGKEAIAAYRKFLTGQPLVEKPVSRDHPQVRIPAKMKRVRAGIERWHKSGKDAVGSLLLGLFAENTFPTRPPRFIRADFYRYQLEPLGAPNTWRRTPAGQYLPPTSLSDFN
jgi:hypothetical protein